MRIRRGGRCDAAGGSGRSSRGHCGSAASSLGPARPGPPSFWVSLHPQGVSPGCTRGTLTQARGAWGAPAGQPRLPGHLGVSTLLSPWLHLSQQLWPRGMVGTGGEGGRTRQVVDRPSLHSVQCPTHTAAGQQWAGRTPWDRLLPRWPVDGTRRGGRGVTAWGRGAALSCSSDPSRAGGSSQVSRGGRGSSRGGSSRGGSSASGSCGTGTPAQSCRLTPSGSL